MKTKGYIVYEGPSVLDGAPIVMILTLETTNRKTGNMAQTWILRSDMPPMEASKAKLDSSICGNCPHKWSAGGACYVNIGQAPTSVYRAYKRGTYQRLIGDPTPANNLFPLIHYSYHHILHRRKVRLGAYGDPAAVPVRILKALATYAAGHTGYTHQMGHRNFDPRVLHYCMASTETVKPSQTLWENRARTFRIVQDITEILPGEVECLADAEGVNCADCMLCTGSDPRDTHPSPNVVIAVHGSRAGRFLNNAQQRKTP